MSDTTNVESVASRRVWDSRGHPTVEVEVTTSSGKIGRAIAPAGASRGLREAIDLRDGGDQLGGKNVYNACENVRNIIAPALVGKDVCDQSGIDELMIALDGTPDKSKLGGNAMVATSLAVLHAGSAAQGRPLWKYISEKYQTSPSIPLPEIQICGGGAHAGRRVDIQDFMIMVPGANSFDEVMEITSAVYWAAGQIIEEKTGGVVGVADEGGWWPVFNSNEEALETLMLAIERAGETPGDRVVISLDVAASEFYDGNGYKLSLEDRVLDTGGMIDMLGSWLGKYPIVSIEDALAEQDVAGTIEFTKRFGDRLQIVGDDYLVTNADLVKAAIKDKACNAVLIKVNQAGTVSESVSAFKAASAGGFRSVVSARSGETEDVSITHLSAGLGAGQLKVGSFTRSERMAKWNECLRIQDAHGMGSFAAGSALKNTWWGKG